MSTNLRSIRVPSSEICIFSHQHAKLPKAANLVEDFHFHATEKHSSNSQIGISLCVVHSYPTLGGQKKQKHTYSFPLSKVKKMLKNSSKWKLVLHLQGGNEVENKLMNSIIIFSSPIAISFPI